jgi:hypothetical protein
MYGVALLLANNIEDAPRVREKRIDSWERRLEDRPVAGVDDKE